MGCEMFDVYWAVFAVFLVVIGFGGVMIGYVIGRDLD